MMCMKQMAAVSTAFDNQTYQKLISRHIFDVLKIPESVLTMLLQGALNFVVSISGRPWHSVGIDEGHEVLINKAINYNYGPILTTTT